MINGDTGLLLNEKNLKLQRKWFIEMCHLLGLKALYRFPLKPSKDRDINGELRTLYSDQIETWVIYEEQPEGKTLKKLGWTPELNEEMFIISVPYDLPELQEGALISLPAPFDGAERRLFRVIKMSGIMIYPASITCRVAPEYDSDFDRSQLDHMDNDTNLLRDGDHDLNSGQDFMFLNDSDREDNKLR